MTDIVKRLAKLIAMHGDDQDTAALSALLAERDELQAIFERSWDADMRAIASWQAANPGNDMVWPDRSKLTLWMLSEIDRLRAERDMWRQENLKKQIACEQMGARIVALEAQLAEAIERGNDWCDQAQTLRKRMFDE